MRIVHVTTYDSQGGAAKATYRIHKSLLEKGVESDMLVLNGLPRPKERVHVFKKSILFRAKDYFFLKADKFLFRRHLKINALPFSFNIFSRISIKRNNLIRNADIVCLYWVGANFLTPGQIASINKPVIWRFSDKWALTGGCHLSGSCRKYEEKCGNCPQLKYPRKNDFTNLIWKLKSRKWENRQFTIVTPSSWMEAAAKRSSIFGNKRIVRIPTGVDTVVFHPVKKISAKEKLGIESKKTVLLFGAFNSLNDTNKGSAFFESLVSFFPTGDFEFLAFGSRESGNSENHKEIKQLGFINDEKELALIYQAADIFICPSIEDNLPNTVLEAMSCGTPCIAFKDSGGVADVIEHMKNGYLAEYKCKEDLVNGVKWVLKMNHEGGLSLKARNKILEEFHLEKQVDRFIQLYHTLLK